MDNIGNLGQVENYIYEASVDLNPWIAYIYIYQRIGRCRHTLFKKEYFHLSKQIGRIPRIQARLDAMIFRKSFNADLMELYSVSEKKVKYIPAEQS